MVVSTNQSTHHFICAAVCALLCLGAATAAPIPAGKQAGFNFLNGEWSSYKYDSPQAQTSLELLQSTTNGSWIALTFCWYQWDVTTPGPIYSINGTSPTNAQITAIVNQAHSLGIKVMLRPLVDPDWRNPKNSGQWRGNIGQGFNESDWDVWFDTYSSYISLYAQLAESLGADEFCVGGELVTASKRASQWVNLTSLVREAYSGPILYAANHGNEVFITWWGSVDIIGVDAYYPLCPLTSTPSLGQLADAWAPLSGVLFNLSNAFGRPVVFSEVGYCSCKGANVMPWECPTDTFDDEAQANLYTALFEALWDEEWFIGVYWWDWLTAADGGSSNGTASLSPVGNSAQSVVASYYSE